VLDGTIRPAIADILPLRQVDAATPAAARRALGIDPVQRPQRPSGPPRPVQLLQLVARLAAVLVDLGTLQLDPRLRLQSDSATRALRAWLDAELTMLNTLIERIGK
jgi:hypothetical protein